MKHFFLVLVSMSLLGVGCTDPGFEEINQGQTEQINELEAELAEKNLLLNSATEDLQELSDKIEALEKKTIEQAAPEQAVNPSLKIETCKAQAQQVKNNTGWDLDDFRSTFNSCNELASPSECLEGMNEYELELKQSAYDKEYSTCLIN